MTLIYFILILGITIFIHELGHFLFAKQAKVHVYEFALGMGPKLHSFKRKNDETMYTIRLFPIGGFVSMAGEETEDEKIDKNKQLNNKSFVQKFMIFIAGVLFNFVLALFLLFILGLVNGTTSYKPVIGSLDSDYSAYYTSLKTGDLILEFNDTKITTIDDLNLLLQVNYSKPITLRVKHADNRTEDITIDPTYNYTKDAYYYGFGIDQTVSYGVINSIKYSFIKTFSLLKQMNQIVIYLFTGKLSISSLSGPVGIYEIVDSLKSNISNILYLIAYLCINVGYINLLPLPVFDGGKLLFLIIEKITKKKINPKIENIILNISFGLLMLLVLVITYNDILNLG